MDTPAVTITGIITPEGLLQLEQLPNLPPGPVRVTVQRMQAISPAQSPRLPDEPWPDENIAAPIDLPRIGPRRDVHAQPGSPRLPDPAFWDGAQQ